MALTLNLFVSCLSWNKHLPYTALTDWFFVTKVESVLHYAH